MNNRFDKKGRSVYERLGKARLNSRDISELIGICKGVLADGTVNLHEASFILQWLEDHRSVVDTWPADLLYESLDNMLEDGKLGSTQEGQLLGLLLEITGMPIRIELSVSTGSAEILDSVERNMQTPTSLPVNKPKNGLIFADMNFVFTGHFLYGSRNDCENTVKNLGGKAQKTVTRTTNYLVVGDVGSESWAHSSFGRKIEKAVYMRESGQQIYIIQESTWTEFLPS